MYAMGAPTPRAYLAASLAYTLKNGVAERIACPTLVCEAEGDLFFKGQPQELYDHLTCRKTLMRFTEDEGAGAHCQAGAGRLAFAPHLRLARRNACLTIGTEVTIPNSRRLPSIFHDEASDTMPGET